MILHVRQRENSKRGFLKMKIKVLFLLVTTILNASGATIDTAQIDRLTGLKGKLNEKEGAYKNQFHPRRCHGFRRWLENTGFHGTQHLGRTYQRHA